MTKQMKLMIALLFSVLAGNANAGFIGNTIQGQWYFPDATSLYSDPFSAVVGAGVEFPDGSLGIIGDSYDFSDTTILMEQTFGSFTPASFNGVKFTDILDTVADIVNVTINVTGSSYTGFDASRITFDANNIWLNVQGLSQPGHVLLDVEFASVPEPASIGIFALGLLAAFGVRRFKRA